MSGRQSATAGAVTQLAAQGLADAVLTGNPQVTFWRFVAKAYTNFALESQLLDFTAGQPYFGAFPKCNLDRIGDLVYWMYAVFDLPGVATFTDSQKNALATGENRPFWTNSIGQALIESANFFIGGQNIDYMKGEFLFIWEELTGQPGKHLREMTGNFGGAINTLQAVSAQPRRLYVPLPFWFTLNSGLALPLVSLQFHSVAVSIKIRPLSDLLRFTRAGMVNYSVSTNVFPVFKPWDPSYVGGSVPDQVSLPASQVDSNQIQAQNLGGYIEVCYVYLDQRERSKFADGAFEQLMIEHQETSTQVDQSATGPATGPSGSASLVPVAGAAVKKNFELNFNHTIIELFWAARLGSRESYQGTNNTGVRCDFYNDWFNFAGPELPVYGQQPALYDPVDLIQLRLNNATRFGDVEGRYFRLVQPWQHHTNIPSVSTQAVVQTNASNVRTFDSIINTAFIYSYSFALQPEDVQPSGSCNFSRIDNTQLNITLNRHLFYGNSWNGPAPYPDNAAGNDSNSSVTFLVFATNWNILRFKYGLGGKRFAN